MESSDTTPAPHEGKPRILALCPPPGVIAFLRQVVEITIEVVRTKAKAQDLIDKQEWALFLLHHRGLPGGADSLLAKIRQGRQNAHVPIVYCLGKEMDPELAKKLVGVFGVQTLLTYPQDPREIAHHIAGLLGLSVSDRDSPPSRCSTAHDELSPVQKADWEQFKSALTEQVATLERVATDLLEGTLADNVKQEAARQCRCLGLDGGGYGMTDVLNLANEAEQLLRHDGAWSPASVLRLCNLAVEFREKTDALAQLSASDVIATKARSLVLVVCREEPFLALLRSEAPNHDIRIVAAPSVDRAMEVMAHRSPDLVLLDIGADGASREELGFVGELAAHNPAIPVLVLTEGDSFKDRVAVAGAGGQGVVDKRESGATILAASKELLGQTRTDVPKVLVVDDSELISRLAGKLLERRGLHVTTLTDPLKFWDVLEHVNPDLLILDVEMPHLNGIELCRVVRTDPNWELLPIVFLSAHTDAHTIQRLFVAGADDYISKPIVSGELIMRVQNRLGRARLYRHRTEMDVLTGVASRKAVEHRLERALRSARRYRDSFSLAVIDVDHLTQINDRHQTATGDMVLRRLGQILAKFFRSEDVVGRLGGDEFVIGIHRASKASAQTRVEELLRLVRRERFSAENGQAFTISVSAGLAEFPEDGSERDAIYHAAGHALASAKAAGRDRVVATGELGRPVVAEQYDVVIVDDDDAVTDMLVRMLVNQGYRPCRLRDGEEAFQRLSGANPDIGAKVLLLEVDLPGLDGISILRRLVNESGLHRMRVIMLTHRSGEDEVAAMFELGAFDHVTKPFSARILLQRIRRAIAA